MAVTLFGSAVAAPTVVLAVSVLLLAVLVAVQRRRRAAAHQAAKAALEAELLACSVSGALPAALKEAPLMPGALPVVGHLPLMAHSAHQVLADAARSMQADVFQLRMGANPYYVVASQEGINEVFNGPRSASFAGRPMLQSALDMTRGEVKHVIFGPNNDFHQWARKFAVQRLLSTQALKSFQPFIVEARDQLLRELAEAGANGTVAFDPMPILARAPMRVTFRVLLGEELPGVAAGTSQRIADWIREGSEFVCNNMGDFLPFMNTLRLNPKRAAVEKWFVDYEEIVLPYIRQHEATLNPASPRDFLDTMLIFRESAECTPEERAFLDDTGLTSMVLGLFAAAADTLFCNLSFLLCYMAENPGMLARAHAEIDAAVGAHRLADFDDSEQLPYTRAVVKEIFRCRPSVPIALREVQEDTVLQGYFLPKGAGLYVHTYAMQNDERVYGPDAKEFKPERFLDNLACLVGTSKEQKWVPYGGGERSCIGYRLAQLENFMFSAAILQCFDVVHPTPGVKYSDRERFGLSICPESYTVFMKPRPAFFEAGLDTPASA